MRRLAGHYVLTPDGLLPGGIVTVDNEGVVTDVASSEQPDKLHGVEFYSGIIIPGMVNAHTHLELSHMKGLIPEGCGFTGFVSSMGKAREGFSDADKLAAASFRDAKMWAEGVSAAADISNSGLTFEVKSASRIKYHNFIEVYGLRTESSAEAVELVETAVRAGMTASVTPHSMYSLNERLMRETVSAGDGLLSVHFMESPDESRLFEQRGAMQDWYSGKGFEEDFTGKYASPAERLMASVPAENKILLVHITFVSESEIKGLKDFYGDNLTWVLCPRSNRYITGELPPVAMLRDAGCRIAVGTDSLASNRSLSVMEELKLFDGIPLEELLVWATRNGARALGLEDRLGTIAPGKAPGLVLLENVDLKEMRLTEGSMSRRLV